MAVLDAPMPPHPRPAPADPSDGHVLVRLTGLHSSMPEAELRALGLRTIGRRGRIVLCAIARAAALGGTAADLRRLGYAAAVYTYLGSGGPDRLPFDARSVIRGSYAVAVDGAPPHTRRAIYGLVWRGLDRPVVDLRDPDDDLLAVVGEDTVWWGRLVHRFAAADFAARDASHRPFKRPVVVQPRKARCMVNLSGVGRGDLFLDPCSGTGSFPIEAALVGARSYASDVDRAMVRGTAANARWAGTDVEVRELDACALDEWGVCFDAIVTDLPYGRLASLHHVDRPVLYEKFLASAAQVLRPGGRAVVMAPLGALPEPGRDLRVVERFEEYVHRSLTREIVVYERSGG